MAREKIHHNRGFQEYFPTANRVYSTDQFVLANVYGKIAHCPSFQDGLDALRIEIRGNDQDRETRMIQP